MKSKDSSPSIAHNFVMNAVLMCSNVLFPLVTYPYVSRILKPYGMGLVSFANAIVTYFTMFAQLGIPTYGIRVCAGLRDDREKLSRTVHEILFINTLTCIVSYTAFLALLLVNEKMRQEKTLFLVMSTAVVFNTIGAEWLYKALEKYTYITVRSLIFKLVALVCVFLFVHGSGDYVVYGFITVLAFVGSYAMNFINLRRLIYIRPLGGYSPGRHVKPILVFFGMSVATTIYTNMDSVMLGFIKGAAENGCYDAAVKIKNISVSIVTALGTVLLPRVAYYWESGDRSRFRQAVRKALCLEFMAGISAALFFAVFAGPAIRVLSGELFAGAVRPMQVIMLTLPLIGLSNITGIQILVPVGLEKYVLYSEIAGAVVNVAINSLAIPALGATGAALGTLAAEAVVLAFQLYVLRSGLARLFCGTKIWKMAAAAVTAAVVSAGAGAGVRACSAVPAAELAAGGAVFFGIYAAMLFFMKEQTLRECLQILQRRAGSGRKRKGGSG